VNSMSSPQNQPTSTRDQKRALLAEILRRQVKTARTEGPSPLSYGQRALFSLYDRAPESSAYNTKFVMNVRSALDIANLRKSLHELVERHAILRTVYGLNLATGEPFQEVRPTAECDFAIIDAAAWSDKEIAERIEEECRKPFDLRHGPAFRVRLISRSTIQHKLLLSAHHIAVDYWSFAILSEELNSVYASFQTLGRCERPIGQVPYTEYVRWQGEMADGNSGRTSFDYWRKQISDDFAPLELPTDRPRPATQSFHGATYRFALEPALVREMEALARKHGKTPYTVALSAFLVLLHRYSGQDKVLVGSPAAGRTSERFENVVGYFANLLVISADCRDNPPFCEFLERVSDTVFSGLEHQDFPFSLLVEKLGMSRQANRSPICDVLFGWDKPHFSQPSDAPQERLFEVEHAGQMDGPFDLILLLFEGRESISAGVQYNTDLFDAATIERFAEHYKRILRQAVRYPDQRINALSLLEPDERIQLLEEWSGRTVEYPRNSCIHQLFEEQATDRPDAVALQFGAQQITYGELNRHANQLARRLKKRGVEAGSMVGLCLTRSPNLIVATLAVLKAGGVYVPFDPDYPAERLEFMIRDTGTNLIVTEKTLAPRLEGLGANLLQLDNEFALIGQEDSCALPCETGPDDLAYLMYTSGSTGQPKGVCIPHRGVVRLVKGADYTEFGPDKVFLQFAPTSFDAATFEIWGALLHGARLVIAPPGKPSFGDLADLINQSGVTTLWLTTSVFNFAVDQCLESLGRIQHVLTGGDVASAAHIQKFGAAFPGCRLTNAYGPTENTTFTTCHEIKDVAFDRASISIGKPIPNTRVYLLDDNLSPVPIGVPGELYTAGDGLAREYWRRPELTAERFINNPFGSGRMYRTGDIARYRPDGTIEFLGRKDEQIKIRGFRVELGEIAAVLRTHPQVADAAAIVRQVATGMKQILAYVVGKPANPPAAGALHEFLKAALPEHMIPSAIVLLDRMPITSNGKLDRSALPLPQTQGVRSESETVEPGTPVERTLVGIWQKVLKTEKVGVLDNFFALGGDSITGMQMIALSKRAGITITPAQLFLHQTIHDLAKLAESKLAASFHETVSRPPSVADKSDFPAAKLSPKDLEGLLARISKGSAK
jgi:amino acid adenylation domain-containing protein